MIQRITSIFLLVFAAGALALEDIPRGILPDVATPLAYRLDLTVVPERERFSGHVEIDVQLKQKTRSLYLHGRGLEVSRANAVVAGRKIRASYREVEASGVARLDFARALPAGKVTLVFDYEAAFGDSASGLYRAKVAGEWYAWTQFQSIDARAAFPGFDQPGYKTPFTVSLTTRPGDMAISNGAETGTERRGDLVRHTFELTKPLPTYLVAFSVGPFVSASTTVPPNEHRTSPLPVRILATRPYADRLDFALRNTVPIVELLERYFGSAFPYSKLDQIGSPLMPGAMENAGAVIYGDASLLLDAQAPVRRLRGFGMIVAHELAHQWFGDLVTPAWWDDIWLNESFANWMGYRIGNEWRPDLMLGAAALSDGFSAMDIDALRAGRPIHQPITMNGEIDSAFDSVTYGKGGHVVAMIADYLGDARFQAGVRLHMQRHAHGTATTEQFFASLADAAGDARVLASLKGFVDQQGVPVVRIERAGTNLAVSQQRYGLYGTQMPQQRWIIPLCMRSGATRDCRLLDTPSATMPAPGTGALMPNAGGTGYYRFALTDSDWRALIAEAPRLPPGEALALTDSLWAGFHAGEVAPALLLDAARLMRGNAYSAAAVDAAGRLQSLRRQGLLPEAALPGYRAFVAKTWGPLLTPLGFDARQGKHAADEPERQQLRAQLVSLLAEEARDPAIRSRLADAAGARLKGDASALDDTFLYDGLAAHLAEGDEAALGAVFEHAVTSDDTRFRRVALAAMGSTGRAAAGRWLISRFTDARLRPGDRLMLMGALANEPETLQMTVDWVVANYDLLVKDAGIFAASSLPGLASELCSADAADAVESAFRPLVRKHGRGELALDRGVEEVRSCGLLREHRQAELAQLFL